MGLSICGRKEITVLCSFLYSVWWTSLGRVSLLMCNWFCEGLQVLPFDQFLFGTTYFSRLTSCVGWTFAVERVYHTVFMKSRLLRMKFQFSKPNFLGQDCVVCCFVPACLWRCFQVHFNEIYNYIRHCRWQHLPTSWLHCNFMQVEWTLSLVLCAMSFNK